MISTNSLLFKCSQTNVLRLKGLNRCWSYIYKRMIKTKNSGFRMQAMLYRRPQQENHEPTFLNKMNHHIDLLAIMRCCMVLQDIFSFGWIDYNAFKAQFFTFIVRKSHSLLKSDLQHICYFMQTWRERGEKRERQTLVSAHPQSYFHDTRAGTDGELLMTASNPCSL